MTIPWTGDERAAPPITSRPIRRPTSHRPPGFCPSGEETPDLPASPADDDPEACLRGFRGLMWAALLVLPLWGLLLLFLFVLGYAVGAGWR